jgi:hypothetical protein
LHTGKVSDVPLDFRPGGQIVNFALNLLGLLYGLIETTFSPHGEFVPIASAFGTQFDNVVDEFALERFFGKCRKLTQVKSVNEIEDRKRLENWVIEILGRHCLFRPAIDNVGQQ